jgi:hypothetical protein
MRNAGTDIGDLTGLARCYQPSTGVIRYEDPEHYDNFGGLLAADDRVYTYRSRGTVPAAKRVSGKQLRKAVLHGQRFHIVTDGSGELELEDVGSERQYVLYPHDSGHTFKSLKPVAVVAGVDNPSEGYLMDTYPPSTYSWWAYGPFRLSKNSGANHSINMNLDWSYNDLKQAGVNWANRVMYSQRPLASSSNLTRFLGELAKDGLPAFVGTQLLRRVRDPGRVVSSVGGEYLNVVFGIKPTLSDIKRMADRIISVNTKLAEKARELEGLRVTSRLRRSFTERDDIQTKDATLRYGPSSYVQGPASSFSTYYSRVFEDYHGLGRGISPGTITRQWKSSYVLSSAFDVFVEDILSDMASMQSVLGRAKKVLDLKATPSTGYDLVPFSWMANWFFDASGFIRKAELLADDRVVLRYAYLTRKVQKIQTFAASGYIKPRNGPIFKPLVTVEEGVTLSRHRATPYGFGLSEVDLNPFQWSVVTALGLAAGGKLL